LAKVEAAGRVPRGSVDRVSRCEKALDLLTGPAAREAVDP
jgi:hypothetical protein